MDELLEILTEDGWLVIDVSKVFSVMMCVASADGFAQITLSGDELRAAIARRRAITGQAGTS